MSIPPIAAGGAPAPVSAATTASSKESDAAREAGEGFERLLLGQLTRTLLDSALPEDESSVAAGPYKDQLPDALTEALMSGGGIGLAKTLQEAGS